MPGKSAAVPAGNPTWPLRAAAHHPLWLAEASTLIRDSVWCCKPTCRLRQSRFARHASACQLPGQLLKHGTPKAAATNLYCACKICTLTHMRDMPDSAADGH